MAKAHNKVSDIVLPFHAFLTVACSSVAFRGGLRIRSPTRKDTAWRYSDEDAESQGSMQQVERRIRKSLRCTNSASSMHRS